jgi:hypothetical protein
MCRSSLALRVGEEGGEMSKLTAEEIQEIHFRLNGSHAGPWSPDYTFAKECGGGRFWGNRMLQCIAALEAELAEAREIDSVQASMLGPLRDELDRVKAERDELQEVRKKDYTDFLEARALAAKYKEALEWYASIDYVTHEWGRCSVGDRARQALAGDTSLRDSGGEDLKSCEECGMQTGHRTGCWIGFKKLNAELASLRAELAAAEACIEKARSYAGTPRSGWVQHGELKAALAAYDALRTPRD